MQDNKTLSVMNKYYNNKKDEDYNTYLSRMSDYIFENGKGKGVNSKSVTFQVTEGYGAV